MPPSWVDLLNNNLKGQKVLAGSRMNMDFAVFDIPPQETSFLTLFRGWRGPIAFMAQKAGQVLQESSSRNREGLRAIRVPGSRAKFLRNGLHTEPTRGAQGQAENRVRGNGPHAPTKGPPDLQARKSPHRFQNNPISSSPPAHGSPGRRHPVVPVCPVHFNAPLLCAEWR